MAGSSDGSGDACQTAQHRPGAQDMRQLRRRLDAIAQEDHPGLLPDHWQQQRS